MSLKLEGDVRLELDGGFLRLQQTLEAGTSETGLMIWGNMPVAVGILPLTVSFFEVTFFAAAACFSLVFCLISFLGFRNNYS